MNNSVPEMLELSNNFSINPSVATQDFGWEKNQSNQHFTVISAGRFVPLKGFDLTIEAFAKMIKSMPYEDKKKCQLILVGNGPEEVMLQKICAKNNIEHQVKFISWLERDVLMHMFKTSSVFMFPSHEGAGMVVAEALSFGLPVVCLDNEGPGNYIDETCGVKVKISNYEDTTEELSEALKTLYSDISKHNNMRVGARKRFEDVFHWDRRGEQLQKIYADL
jgi:glycosyltransferase involved in cell wall biosynthesis